MAEKFERSPKRSEEDIEFFNKLAEKYGLDQDEEFLIIRKGATEHRIPKWRNVPANKKFMRIEDRLEELLAEYGDEKIERNE